MINTIDCLATSSLEATSIICRRLHEYINGGKFKIIDNLFWCQPTVFWAMYG